jgi:hypothetical protein
VSNLFLPVRIRSFTYTNFLASISFFHYPPAHSRRSPFGKLYHIFRSFVNLFFAKNRLGCSPYRVILLSTPPFVPILARKFPPAFVRSRSFVRVHSFAFIRSRAFARVRSFAFIRSRAFARVRSFAFVRVRSFSRVRPHSPAFILPRSFARRLEHKKPAPISRGGRGAAGRGALYTFARLPSFSASAKRGTSTSETGTHPAQ